MIQIRRFRPADAAEVAQVVATTLNISNSQDYLSAYLEATIKRMSPQFFLDKAEQTHFYIVHDGNRIVGTGAIGSYWGSTTEYSLFDIFVLPTYQKRGIGELIIHTLERVEIPASITAVNFYRHMGYTFKKGHETVDEEQLYRLEKFPHQQTASSSSPHQQEGAS